MKKKPLLMLTIVAILIFALGQTAMAFSDVSNDPNADKIKALKEQGVLSGTGNDQFKPGGELTYAAGVSMIVKGLGLNIDNISFFKEPKASDSFPNLEDDAWYSQAFIIAGLNGLDIPKDVQANDPMTKEQYAHHLFQAVLTHGDYAFIKIYMIVADEADVNPAYMDSIQKLLITKIASVDKDGNFFPTKNMTRGEAAAWLHDASAFVEEATPIEPQPEPELPLYDLKLDVTAVNADVSKVTVSAQMPHPGYGLRIASIVFEGEQAILYVEPTLPDPDMMYPQVITDVEIVTYVDAAFKPVLAEHLTGSIDGQDAADAAINSHIAQ